MEDSPDDAARVSPLADETIRAQKLEAVARLAPGITHELNNPLAAIVGFAELLRTDPRLPDDMRRQAELLSTETARTRVLIQALLDFLRARPAERHPTPVRALIESVLLLHGYRLAAGQIEVVVDVAADVPDLTIDRAGLQLVLINLLQEAVDSLPAPGGAGRLEIRAMGHGASVRISVRRDAPDLGAPSTERDRAWQVSSAIVADHDGNLVRTANEVTLTLPAATRAAAAGGAQAGGTGSPPTAAVRVLILDDERSIGMLLERWLRTSGYAPTVASSGVEAIELVRETRFDAVLCDHRMMGMAGTEVFDAMVAIRPDLGRRFVFMSGDVLNPALQAFVARRGVGLLAKPFDLETVRSTLEAVLRS